MRNIKELKVVRHRLGVGRRRRNRSYIHCCVEFSHDFIYLNWWRYVHYK